VDKNGILNPSALKFCPDISTNDEEILHVFYSEMLVHINLPLGATGGGNHLRKQHFGACGGFLRTAFLAWQTAGSPAAGGTFF